MIRGATTLQKILVLAALSLLSIHSLRSYNIRFPNEESVQEKQVLQIGIFPNMFKRTKTFTLAG